MGLHRHRARCGVWMFASFGILLGGCAGTGGPGAVPAAAPNVLARAVARATPRPALFVASASPYFVNGYALPLRTGDRPVLRLLGVQEPVPVAAGQRSLYVGSFNNGAIFTYPLPTVTSSHDPKIQSSFVASGLHDLSGLAVTATALFAAGEGPNGEEVLEYRLPLMAGAKPVGAVTGFPVLDFLSVAAARSTLYVASAARGTVGAYRLPLRDGEPPEYTIATQPQADGATGVAVDRRNAHLYVSLYRTGDVYRYRLPYGAGEKPFKLGVRMQTGQLPYGIAVGAGRLFVTAGSILSYRLPLNARSTPEAIVAFAQGNAAGLAVRP